MSFVAEFCNVSYCTDRVNVNTTDATASATALLLPAQNTHTLHGCPGSPRCKRLCISPRATAQRRVPNLCERRTHPLKRCHVGGGRRVCRNIYHPTHKYKMNHDPNMILMNVGRHGTAGAGAAAAGERGRVVKHRYTAINGIIPPARPQRTSPKRPRSCHGIHHGTPPPLGLSSPCIHRRVTAARSLQTNPRAKISRLSVSLVRFFTWSASLSTRRAT